MLEDQFEPYVRDHHVRHRLSDDLSELYKLRIMADYRGRERLDRRTAEARRRANQLVKIACTILPESRTDER